MDLLVELVRVNERLTGPETYNPLLRLIDEINKEEAVNNWIHSTNQLKQSEVFWVSELVKPFVYWLIIKMKPVIAKELIYCCLMGTITAGESNSNNVIEFFAIVKTK